MSKVLNTQALELEFDPQNPHKKPGRMLRAFNPSAGKTETGPFLEFAD